MKRIKILFLFAVVLVFGLIVSCSDDSEETPTDTTQEEETTGETNEEEEVEYTVWTGVTITFDKQSGADPTLEENQDRITDGVWITRGNDGGGIYNAVEESSEDKNVSPSGTLWAIGTTADLENLDFVPFRTAFPKPKDTVVGTNAVMLIEEGNIAIDITFTRWSSNKLGGFAYERSTE